MRLTTVRFTLLCGAILGNTLIPATSAAESSGLQGAIIEGECSTNNDCDDGLSCTSDACVDGTCANNAVDDRDCNNNDIADTCELESIGSAVARNRCADAQPICPGYVYFGSTTNATQDGTGCVTSGVRDVWYSYTPASDGTVTIIAYGFDDSGDLSAFVGCPATKENAVRCGFVGSPVLWFEVVGGVEYRIGYSGLLAPIEFSLQIDGPPCVGSVEDCNENSVPDQCDIVAGFEEDCNDNGVPDECEVVDGLYAVPSGNGRLFRIDEGANEATYIKSLATDSALIRLRDIEWSPQQQVLYGIQGSGHRSIHAIDPKTGDVLRTVRHRPGVLHSLEFDREGRLLGIFGAHDLSPSELVEVDPESGHITSIGPTGFGVIGGMAFDPAFEILYGLARVDDEHVLVDINPVTGIATSIGSTDLSVSYSGGAALEFDSQGRLLAADSAGTLFVLNPETAETTAIGWPGIIQLNGLALVDWDPDCNADDTLDFCEDYAGTIVDCDANGVPDACQPAEDCNANGVSDICDIADDTSIDCNFNYVPDECEVDCNADGIPDECIVSFGIGTLADCNENLIPDDCDIAAGASVDCNSDGIPDECQTDCDQNGVADECDLALSPELDENMTGVIDSCEHMIYVDLNARGSSTGVTWRQAYRDLGTALTDAAGSATPITQVWVAAGTYKPGELREDTFQVTNGVRLYGGFAGGETRLGQRDVKSNRTVLSGAIEEDAVGFGNNCCSPHLSEGCDDTVCADAVCDRLDSCCSFQWGMRCADLAHEVCADVCQTRPSIHVVTISNADESTVLDGFIITGGEADYDGESAGGGMSISESSPMIVDCTFVRNVARSGGGVQVDRGSHPTFLNCGFFENIGFFCGGAISHFGQSDSVIINSVINGNYSTIHGAVSDFAGDSTLTNCTITQNRSRFVGSGVMGSRTKLSNCIIWGNESSATTSNCQICGGYPELRYSFSQQPVSGGARYLEGNLQMEDPRFVDADGADDIPGTEDDDLRLLPDSPCIDAGDNDADVDSIRRGRQALPSMDFDGRPRMQDDVDTPDTGIGEGAVVDMGAFEAFPDCNDNGIHDTVDLAEMGDCNGNASPDDCDVALQISPDCNDTGLPDECDILLGTSADANANGVPDECNCVYGSQCADGDVCTFDGYCDGVICVSRGSTYGDLGGSESPCDPDGAVDLFDILVVLDAFADPAAEACSAVVADIAECRADGKIDLRDVLAVLDAFQGIDPCCEEAN